MGEYEYTPVKLTGVYDYWQYFVDRWQEGKTFINVEHDIAFWPGALEEIWDCPRDWCMYAYSCDHDFIINTPYLGLVKFDKSFIEPTKDQWQDTNKNWQVLDQELNRFARACGFTPHQHYPAVINANPNVTKQHYPLSL